MKNIFKKLQSLSSRNAKREEPSAETIVYTFFLIYIFFFLFLELNS